MQENKSLSTAWFPELVELLVTIMRNASKAASHQHLQSHFLLLSSKGSGKFAFRVVFLLRHIYMCTLLSEKHCAVHSSFWVRQDLGLGTCSSAYHQVRTAIESRKSM